MKVAFGDITVRYYCRQTVVTFHDIYLWRWNLVTLLWGNIVCLKGILGEFSGQSAVTFVDILINIWWNFYAKCCDICWQSFIYYMKFTGIIWWHYYESGVFYCKKSIVTFDGIYLWKWDFVTLLWSIKDNKVLWYLMLLYLWKWNLVTLLWGFILSKVLWNMMPFT